MSGVIGLGPKTKGATLPVGVTMYSALT